MLVVQVSLMKMKMHSISDLMNLQRLQQVAANVRVHEERTHE